MSGFAIALALLSAAIHAGWNLLAHFHQVGTSLYLRCSLVAGLIGLVPELIAEFRGDSFSLSVWSLVIVTSLLHCIYYLGLTMGYRSGNFTVIYPVSRALPILLLGFFDLGRGQLFILLGWLGMILVMLGCLLAPLESLRKITVATYWNRSTIWILVITFSVTGFTALDKVAAELMPTGAGEVARYDLLQALFAVPFLWVALKLIGEPIDDKPVEESADEQKKPPDWKWLIVFTLFVYGSYWLMLWAYQLSPYVSYLTALRQFSIVIGVVVAVLFFKEPAAVLRISAAAAIVLGIICITQASGV